MTTPLGRTRMGFYYGPNMTTVRNRKDEIDKRAWHKMLKQLGLSQP